MGTTGRPSLKRCVGRVWIPPRSGDVGQPPLHAAFYAWASEDARVELVGNAREGCEHLPGARGRTAVWQAY
eukprot:4939823-Alexandrium_andersonii.AAC.1